MSAYVPDKFKRTDYWHGLMLETVKTAIDVRDGEEPAEQLDRAVQDLLEVRDDGRNNMPEMYRNLIDGIVELVLPEGGV